MNNRVALVTGAARGIGASIAARLARDGCDVAVLDLDEDQCAETVARVEATGRRGMAVAADVSDEAAVGAAVERVAAELGPPVVLINNAGLLRADPFHKVDLAAWRTILEVNLTGAFLMSQAVHGHMRAERWGRIVNLSSIGALGHRGQSSYSAAKAGLQGLTKTLALELGRFGVTVNAVAPGFTVTEMTRSIAERADVPFERMRDEMAGTIAVGRAGEPEDVANAVAFFADERSGFVSGQVLYVAGGPVD
ncbi:MAG TPA: 3-oxoacyl-ACP reductase FabG [Pseudonocardia sp.]|jgi:3-oxoacyl-[acyl-carrier protein] reductase|nr:3-oxoacyl-ACP reductase FabG [Pseudonocardia sp.]